MKAHGTFKAPVYVTSDRANAMGQGHVFDIQLRTERDDSFWVLQGVAAVLNDE